MKLEEAQRVLDVLTDAPVLKDDPRVVDALKLGIEALKMVDNLRFDGSPYYPKLLPSETED